MTSSTNAASNHLKEKKNKTKKAIKVDRFDNERWKEPALLIH